MKTIKNNNVILSDFHTHTIASGHAFNTIFEMIAEAKRKGIKILGITDHGPAVEGSAPASYFSYGGKYFPRKIDGVEILFGTEINVINKQGEFDLGEKLLSKLDYVIAAFHDEVLKDPSAGSDVTDLMIKALKNPLVKMVSHPYDRAFRVDMSRVVAEAKKQNKILEINCAYIYKGTALESEVDGLKNLIALLQKNKMKTLVNSDAHIITNLGCSQEVWKKLTQFGLRETDILNNNLSEVKKFFKK